jgi:hypothetical protein
MTKLKNKLMHKNVGVLKGPLKLLLNKQQLNMRKQDCFVTNINQENRICSSLVAILLCFKENLTNILTNCH